MIVLVCLALLFLILSFIPGTGAVPWLALSVLCLILIHLLPLIGRAW